MTKARSFNGKAEGMLVRCHNQQIYIGEAKDDLPDGIGELTLSDGSVLDCPFRAGEPCGEGMLTTKDEAIFKGIWSREGEVLKLEGDAVFPDGKRMAGVFKNQNLETDSADYPDGYLALKKVGNYSADVASCSPLE